MNNDLIARLQKARLQSDSSLTVFYIWRWCASCDRQMVSNDQRVWCPDCDVVEDTK